MALALHIAASIVAAGQRASAPMTGRSMSSPTCAGRDQWGGRVIPLDPFEPHAHGHGRVLYVIIFPTYGCHRAHGDT